MSQRDHEGKIPCQVVLGQRMLTAAVTVPVIAVNSGAQYGTQHIFTCLQKLMVIMLFTKAKSTYEAFFSRKELSF